MTPACSALLRRIFVWLSKRVFSVFGKRLALTLQHSLPSSLPSRLRDCLAAGRMRAWLLPQLLEVLTMSVILHFVVFFTEFKQAIDPKYVLV
jgi:hypothetical protein